jgi:hypothetical protein
MTVTSLPSRAALPERLTQLPVNGIRRTLTRRRIPSPLVDTPALTLTFEVTLNGDTRYTDAVEVLDTLRQITDRLDTALVQIAPVPLSGGAVAPDSGATVLSVASAPSPPMDSRAKVEDDSVIRIQPASREVSVRGQPIAFTRVEFDLLLFLAQHPRRVFTRAQLLQFVWGFAHAGQRTVDVHIRRLRAKLGDELVTTVRGVGYRLADKAELRVIQLP